MRKLGTKQIFFGFLGFVVVIIVVGKSLQIGSTMSELIEMQRKKPWCKVSMNLTEKTEWIKKNEGNGELEKKIIGTKIPRVLHQLSKNETIPSKWKVSLFVFHNFYLRKSLKKQKRFLLIHGIVTQTAQSVLLTNGRE